MYAQHITCSSWFLFMGIDESLAQFTLLCYNTSLCVSSLLLFPLRHHRRLVVYLCVAYATHHSSCWVEWRFSWWRWSPDRLRRLQCRNIVFLLFSLLITGAKLRSHYLLSPCWNLIHTCLRALKRCVRKHSIKVWKSVLGVVLGSGSCRAIN